MQKSKEGWKEIGVVGVDAGMLLITDPCYIDSEWEKEEYTMDEEEMVHPDGTVEPVIKCSDRWFACINDINSGKIKLRTRKEATAKHNFSYNACAKAHVISDSGQLNYKAGHPGVGVVFSSGFGDGCYPVFANFKDYGDANGHDYRIREVRINMISDEKDDMEVQFNDFMACFDKHLPKQLRTELTKWHKSQKVLDKI